MFYGLFHTTRFIDEHEKKPKCYIVSNRYLKMCCITLDTTDDLNNLSVDEAQNVHILISIRFFNVHKIKETGSFNVV